MNDKTAPCHDRIWLINMGDEIVWCDDPNPSGNACPDDVSEFVSAEKYHALAAKVANVCRVAHKLIATSDEREANAAVAELEEAALAFGNESLVRLIAEKQAEALDDLRNELMSDLPDPCRRIQVADAFILRIATLRRQAGGDS